MTKYIASQEGIRSLRLSDAIKLVSMGRQIRKGMHLLNFTRFEDLSGVEIPQFFGPWYMECKTRIQQNRSKHTLMPLWSLYSYKSANLIK